MLRIDHLFEDFDLAKRCLSGWEYDEETRMKDFSYFRVSSNAVYPFRQNGKFCFLRIAPVEEKNVAAVESEIEILLWLNAQGFPAMEPVPRADGTYLSFVESEDGPVLCTAFRRVKGADLENVSFDLTKPSEREELLTVARAYGACLGKLHATWKAYPNKHHREDVTDLLAKARARLFAENAPEEMREELCRVENAVSGLAKDPEVFGLVHFDFEPDNVFYDAKTGGISVIDFDDCITCWFALDVVRALDGMDDVIGENDLTEAVYEEQLDLCRKAFLSGYRTEKTFTREQEESIPLMRRLVRITEYAGLLYTLSGSVQNEPEWMTDLRGMLTNQCRCWERAVADEGR